MGEGRALQSCTKLARLMEPRAHSSAAVSPPGHDDAGLSARIVEDAPLCEAA